MRWSTPWLGVLLVVLVLRDTSRVSLATASPAARGNAAAVVAALGGARHTVHGRVETPEHTAIVGATVETILVLEGRSWPLAEALSDDAGGVTFRDLPEASYWVIARAPGRARRVATLRVHGNDPELVLSLGSGATVEGSVTQAAHGDAPPVPLEGIVVRAMPDGGSEGPPFAVRTDGTGRFLLEGLTPGSYRVEVADAHYEPVTRRAVPAPTRGVAIALRALASVRGTVRTASGAAPTDATVVLAGSGVWPPRSTAVHPDGAFEIVGIPAGVYELRAAAGDLVAEPIAPLLLDPGDTREVRMTVTPGASLAGFVVDAVTLRPLAHAHVIVAEDALATSPRAIIAGVDGTFNATGLLRRPHQVSARADGYVARVGTLAMPGSDPVTLALDRQVALTGRVVDRNGAPIGGAQIEVMARDLDGHVSWITASAIAFRDALFAAQQRGPRPLIPAGELGVMPGPLPMIPLAQPNATPGSLFTGDAQHAGYVTDADGRFRVDEVPPGVVTVVATHPAYVRGESAQRMARAGESIDVEIVLHDGGTLDGRLVDDRGFPVAGQPIEVRAATDPMPRRVFSTRDGTFRVPAVLGPLSVVALVGGRIAARADVEVADGQTVPVTLVLDRGVRTLRGRVLDGRGFPVAGADITLAATDHTLGIVRALSAADGTFDAVVSGSGALELDVRHPSFAPHRAAVAPTEQDLAVTLDEGVSATATIDASACATGDLAIELRTPCGPYRRTLRHGASVTFDHLCPGHVTLSASAPGCVGSEHGATLPGEIARLDLAAGGGAMGDVTDGRGDPVPGAIVMLSTGSPEATIGTARSGRRGEFTITDLPDGDLALIAVHPTLGRSRPDDVRIVHGTIARGVRLRFEGDATQAQGTVSPTGFTVVSREGHVVVLSVAADSAAARGGLQAGDEVIAVQGHAVGTLGEARRAFAGPAGDELAVDVRHDGVRRTVRWVRDPPP